MKEHVWINPRNDPNFVIHSPTTPQVPIQYQELSSRKNLAVNKTDKAPDLTELSFQVEEKDNKWTRKFQVVIRATQKIKQGDAAVVSPPKLSSAPRPPVKMSTVVN